MTKGGLPCKVICTHSSHFRNIQPGACVWVSHATNEFAVKYTDIRKCHETETTKQI